MNRSIRALESRGFHRLTGAETARLFSNPDHKWTHRFYGQGREPRVLYAGLKFHSTWAIDSEGSIWRSDGHIALPKTLFKEFPFKRPMGLVVKTRVRKTRSRGRR